MKLKVGHVFLICFFLYVACILLLPGINQLRLIAGDNNYPPLTKFVRYQTLLLFGVFFAAYGTYIHLRRRFSIHTNWLLYGSLTFVLGFYLCAMKPIFSIDLFEYIFRGRIASIYNANPYIIPPSNYPNDIFYPIIFWKFQPTIYGPLWSWLVYLPTKLAQNSIFVNVFLMKALLFVFHLLSAHQIFRLAKLLRLKQPVIIAELFLLNPYLITMTLIDGHNDILLLFFLLWSLVKLMQKKDSMALTLLTVATLAKYITIILFPIFLIVIIYRREALRKKVFSLLGGGILSVLAVCITFWPFCNGKNIFKPLLEITASFTDNTISHLIYRISHLIIPGLSENIFITSAKATFFVILVFIFLRLLKNHAKQKATVSAVFYSLAAFLIIGSFQFGQWYLLWVAPFVLFLNIRFNLLIYMLLTFCALVSFWKRFPYLLIFSTALYFLILFIYYKKPKFRNAIVGILQVS